MALTRKGRAREITPAHSQVVSIRFIERWPSHEPREADPHYHLFLEAKARMRRSGLWKCNVDASYHSPQIEVHHSKIEFAHINDVDLQKFDELYGVDLSDEDFQTYVEEEGNLEALCSLHHRGQEGVHSLPEPEWSALRVSKAGIDIVSVQSNSLIPVIGEKGEST